MSHRKITFALSSGRRIQILPTEIFLTDDNGEILTDDDDVPFTEGPGWLTRKANFTLSSRSVVFTAIDP